MFALVLIPWEAGSQLARRVAVVDEFALLQSRQQSVIMQSVSEPALGTRPLVRTPSWSTAQGVLTPLSRAQRTTPLVAVCLRWFGRVGLFSPRRDPRPAALLLCTNNQQTNFNHKKAGNPISQTNPFICFGAHQPPHSNIHVPNYSTILTLVTILDASFSESKARCITGHETRKRGTASSGANSAAIVAFLQKGEAGAKIILFLRFFLRNLFLRNA